MRKIVTSLLVLFLLFSSTGCEGNNSDSSSVGAVQTEVDIDIWSAYSTAKVIKDPAYNKNHYKLPLNAEVSAARGETESAQVIITTGQNDVKNYTVEIEDLYNDEGVKFPKENINVYFQHYMLIEIKSHNVVENLDNYPLGYTPDGLIPQELSIKHGENYIDSNSNQGITLDFVVPTNAIAGEYNGKCKLNIDGKVTEIPVSLNIWDYDISYTYGKNLWDVVEEFLHGGEWDSKTGDAEVLYYETMLKYKLNAYHFPHDETADGFVDDLKKYWDEPAFNGVFLPDIGGNKDKITRYYTAIAQLAVKNKTNYFEAVAFYHQQVDEPQRDPALYDQTLTICNITKSSLEEFAVNINTYVKGFDSLEPKLQGEIINSIINTEQVVTTYYEASSKLQGVVNAFCPTAHMWKTTKQDRNYTYNAEVTSGKKWTYTCLDPYYPLPSYHIDDYGVSGRVLKWIQKDKNIEGYLNWAINYYGYNNTITDAYKNPIRTYDPISFANGDGYLFYPMAKYSASEPIPSLRLLYARDGQEDYDTLCVLEKQYNTLAEAYGYRNINKKLQENLQNYYTKLFNGFYYEEDDRMFDEIRSAIADLTEAAHNESKTMIVSDVLSSGVLGKVQIYSQADEIYVNGKKQSLKDGCCTYSVNLKTMDSIEVTYKKNNIEKTFTYYLPESQYSVDLQELSASDIEVSEGSVVKKTSDGFDFSIKSQGKTFAEMLMFIPSLKLPVDLEYENVNEISLDLYNLGAGTCEFNVYLYAGTYKYKIDEMILYGYETYTYSLDRIYELTNWDKLQEAEGICFEFKNANSEGALLPDRNISIKSFSYTIKRGDLK